MDKSENNTAEAVQEICEEATANSEIAVEFKNVTFSYKDASMASLSNLSFNVMAGETIGIIGGTGSGKTTLIHLIPRFYDVTEGSILIHGRNIKDYTLTGLRNQMGLVPQHAVLFNGTIRDNIKWGNRDATDEDILLALETAQASEFVKAMKNGLDTMIQQGGKNLSGGQKQRLTIARALVRKPKILILDDSASALDYATDARLRKALAKASHHNLKHHMQSVNIHSPANPPHHNPSHYNRSHGMTVLIVSQRAASIKHADKIIVLEDGKMVGFGSHSELTDTCEVYREICMSQLSHSK